MVSRTHTPNVFTNERRRACRASARSSRCLPQSAYQSFPERCKLTSDMSDHITNWRSMLAPWTEPVDVTIVRFGRQSINPDVRACVHGCLDALASNGNLPQPQGRRWWRQGSGADAMSIALRAGTLRFAQRDDTLCRRLRALRARRAATEGRPYVTFHPRGPAQSGDTLCRRFRTTSGSVSRHSQTSAMPRCH